MFSVLKILCVYVYVHVCSCVLECVCVLARSRTQVYTVCEQVQLKAKIECQDIKAELNTYCTKPYICSGNQTKQLTKQRKQPSIHPKQFPCSSTSVYRTMNYCEVPQHATQHASQGVLTGACFMQASPKCLLLQNTLCIVVVS